MALAVPPLLEEEKQRRPGPNDLAAPGMPLEQQGIPSILSNSAIPSMFAGSRIGKFQLAGAGDVTEDMAQRAGIKPSDAEQKILANAGKGGWALRHAEAIRDKYNNMDPAEKQARNEAAINATAANMIEYGPMHPLAGRKTSPEQLLARFFAQESKVNGRLPTGVTPTGMALI